MSGETAVPDGTNALILFTKVPEPGFVKTRLINPGGSPSPSDASTLYVALLEDTLSAVRDLQRSTRTSLVVSFTPENGIEEMKRIVGGYVEDAEYWPQVGESTTQRVMRAFEDAFAAGFGAVSLVPGDHADLDGRVLAEAFRRLTDPRPTVVIGPTSDGGAYLLGFNRDSFPLIRFDLENTYLVCADIFRKAKEAGIPCTFLENRNDLDDWEDARHYLMRNDLRDTKTWSALQRIGVPSRAGGTLPKVSVIIPVLNEEKTVGGILNSLEKQEKKEFEVIVVDGGSRDETVNKVWGKVDKMVFVEKPSRKGQENIAASNARGSVLLFLHADMTVPPTLIGSLLESLGDASVMGGSSRVVFRERGAKVRFLSAVRLCGSRLLKIHGISSGFYVRRYVFDHAGGFRESVMEEAVDLQRRVSHLGRFVTLDERCTTSARRFTRRGRFLPVLAVWVTTVLLTVLGLHFTSIERKLWRS
jgi:glycosyltransferase A (GT-A) superfamily protein (DUF2064 family)